MLSDPYFTSWWYLTLMGAGKGFEQIQSDMVWKTIMWTNVFKEQLKKTVHNIVTIIILLTKWWKCFSDIFFLMQHQTEQKVKPTETAISSKCVTVSGNVEAHHFLFPWFHVHGPFLTMPPFYRTDPPTLIVRYGENKGRSSLGTGTCLDRYWSQKARRTKGWRRKRRQRPSKL